MRSLESVRRQDFETKIFGNVPNTEAIRNPSDKTLKQKYNSENLKFIRTVDVKDEEEVMLILEELVREHHEETPKASAGFNDVSKAK